MLDRIEQEAPNKEEARVTQPARQGAVTFDGVSLDDGSVLAPVTLAYESWGQLSPAADNVVLLSRAHRQCSCT
jgi:homoserine acetyltransferase